MQQVDRKPRGFFGHDGFAEFKDRFAMSLVPVDGMLDGPALFMGTTLDGLGDRGLGMLIDLVVVVLRVREHGREFLDRHQAASGESATE